MPIWKDPKAYEKKLSRAGWAWEFMRRNPNYRLDYAQVREAWKSVPRKSHLYTGKAWDADHLARELGAKWGQLGAIANPARNVVPAFFLDCPVEPDGDEVVGFYEQSEATGRLVQRLEFATLSFDLRRPLRPQLKRGTTRLRSRKKGVASVKPARSSEKHWGLYLRVLDAKEAGAKTAEIIAAVQAYKGLGKSVGDKYSAQDRVADHNKRGRALRDNPLSLFL